jgi:acyl carrier protein
VDETGRLAIAIDAIASRTLDAGDLQSPQRNPLYRINWQSPPYADHSAPVAVAVLGEAEVGDLDAVRHADLHALLDEVEAGDPPAVVLVDTASTPGDALPQAAHSAARSALELVQRWVAEPRLRDTCLVFLLRAARAVTDGETPDLALAPIWGLASAAQAEHPGSFAVMDTDGDESSTRALPSALALAMQEPQLALRRGEILAPRLVMDSSERRDAAPISSEGTILITGGTGGLGALLARHLVERHGARRLLLVSRRGPSAEGTQALAEDLRDRGADVEIGACDVTDRRALKALIDAIPAEHPLSAVVHAAGVLDDGVVESLNAERLQRVMAPKVDAALYLHELTEHLDLSAFVLFSSAIGLLGGPGQANYTAANAFLDALADHRRTMGLPALSLAWGGWEQQDGMAGTLNALDLARLRRLGFTAMSPDQGLALYDAASASPASLLVPIQFDREALRALAAAGSLPAVLRTLVRAPSRRECDAQSLARRLDGASPAEREAIVLDVVRGHVAALLGHGSAAEVPPAMAFQDLGFDSLTSVELRNRLIAATGLRISATLVFDYPSATQIARHLLTQLVADDRAPAADSEEADLRAFLAQVPLVRLRNAGLMGPLMELVTGAADPLESGDRDQSDQADAIDIDELVEQTLSLAQAETRAGD